MTVIYKEGEEDRKGVNSRRRSREEAHRRTEGPGGEWGTASRCFLNERPGFILMM